MAISIQKKTPIRHHLSKMCIRKGWFGFALHKPNQQLSTPLELQCEIEVETSEWIKVRQSLGLPYSLSKPKMLTSLQSYKNEPLKQMVKCLRWCVKAGSLFRLVQNWTHQLMSLVVGYRGQSVWKKIQKSSSIAAIICIGSKTAVCSSGNQPGWPVRTISKDVVFCLPGCF